MGSFPGTPKRELIHDGRYLPWQQARQEIFEIHGGLLQSAPGVPPRSAIALRPSSAR